MLHLDRLCKHFSNVKTIDDICLDIKSKDLVGIIGRSGTEKSTFLRLINRLTEPTSGSIEFASTDFGSLQGKSLLQLPARCAMIFQQFPFCSPIPHQGTCKSAVNVGSTASEEVAMISRITAAALIVVWFLIMIVVLRAKVASIKGVKPYFFSSFLKPKKPLC